MKKKSLIVEILRHPIFDHEDKWVSAGIHVAPTDFDQKRYQKQIDKICGLSSEGYSIVRVKWAWECRKRINSEWDEFGNATKSEWRQTYCALTLPVDENDTVDIAPPRWVLEMRYEPEQYEHSWELTRYRHDALSCRRCHNRTVGLVENSTSCVQRDLAGPPPREGWYAALPKIGVVAEHNRDGKCCQSLWDEDRQVCWGRYRIPTQRELRALQRAVHLRNQDPEVNPHSVELSPQVLEQIRLDGYQQMAARDRDSKEEAKAYWRDQIGVHGSKVIPANVLQGMKAIGMNPTTRDYFS